MICIAGTFTTPVLANTNSPQPNPDLPSVYPGTPVYGWGKFGGGMNNIIYNLAFDSSGSLYTGDRFTNAGGVSANHIAKWDTTTWSPLGSGINGTVTALAVGSDGTLYAAGSFSIAGGVSANNVAKWDGTTWSAVSTGVNNTVYALALDSSDNLYLGGTFTTAGDGASARTDLARNFSIAVTANNEETNGETDSTANKPALLPAAGFAPRQTTHLPVQPSAKAYTEIDELQLEIPSLEVKLPIVGVPLLDGKWDVSCLGNQAGYLSTTAYPTWNGNTVLTGHVWDANNNPGPFANLSCLRYGDEIRIHMGGSVYTYQVQENHLTLPNDLSAIEHKSSS